MESYLELVFLHAKFVVLEICFLLFFFDDDEEVWWTTLMKIEDGGDNYDVNNFLV